MTESVEMILSDDDLTIVVDSYDGDSAISNRSIGTSIVDGSLSMLESSIVTSEDASETIIGLDLVYSQYANSFQFNITSDSESIFLPLVLLSVRATNLIHIKDASLNSAVIRTGLLFSERISGQFSIDGFELVSQALVGFRHSTGQWFNFTVNGDGFYEFDIAPSGFPTGEYDVYAIAKGMSIPTIEMRFATLTIIEDNTLIVGSIGVAVAALVAIFALRRFRDRRGA